MLWTIFILIDNYLGFYRRSRIVIKIFPYAATTRIVFQPMSIRTCTSCSMNGRRYWIPIVIITSWRRLSRWSWIQSFIKWQLVAIIQIRYLIKPLCWLKGCFLFEFLDILYLWEWDHQLIIVVFEGPLRPLRFCLNDIDLYRIHLVINSLVPQLVY